MTWRAKPAWPYPKNLEHEDVGTAVLRSKSGQGLTLVHFMAQAEHFSCDVLVDMTNCAKHLDNESDLVLLILG
jgi:hypothetical protein